MEKSQFFYQDFFYSNHFLFIHFSLECVQLSSFLFRIQTFCNNKGIILYYYKMSSFPYHINESFLTYPGYVTTTIVVYSNIYFSYRLNCTILLTWEMSETNARWITSCWMKNIPLKMFKPWLNICDKCIRYHLALILYSLSKH